MSNARFSILQARAISDGRISNSQFRTLAALATFGDREGWCYPKLSTLAQMLNKSKQAVSMDIKALVECGYIQVSRQFREDGSQTHNLYRLLYDFGDQAELNPHKAKLNGGLSSEVDGGLSSEVDALTSHLNVPINAPADDLNLSKNSNEFFERHEAFSILENVCKVDVKLKRGQLNKAVKALSAAGYTLDDLRQFESWWYRNDFRGKRGSPPTIQQVIDNLLLSKQLPEIMPVDTATKRIKYDAYGEPVEVE